MIGFGTSSLHRILGQKQRLRLIEMAYDLGVYHFDVAPLYGAGSSLIDLSIFISAHGIRRSEISIASKVGLQWPVWGPNAYKFVAGWNRISTCNLNIRPRRIDTFSGMENQLCRSLDALKINKLDYLFLHEVPIDGGNALDDFVALSERRNGLAVKWGLSGHNCLSCETSYSAQQNFVLQLPFQNIDELLLQIKNRTSNKFAFYGFGQYLAERSEVARRKISKKLDQLVDPIMLFSSINNSHIKESYDYLLSMSRNEYEQQK